MTNLKSLQHAASEAAGKEPPKRRTAEPVPAPVAAAASPARANARAGKIAMTFHLSEDFKRSLRLVQARRGHGCTLEQLAAEALNDLFSKYNVPTVAADG
jgi:hypothetical protein